MLNLLRKLLVCGAVAGTLLAAPQVVWAADIVEPVDDENVPIEERMAPEWTFAIDPFYSWLPGMKGDIRLFGGPGVSIDVTTGDILENLDAFLHAVDGLYMGSGEYRNHQFGPPPTTSASDRSTSAEFGNKITGALDAGFKMSMTTLAANYRVYETEKAYVDLIGGVRLSNIDVDLTITAGPGGIVRSGGDTWVDPVVGLKGRLDLNDNWYVKGNALYGGFGVSSHSLYDVAGLVGYEWQNGFEMYGGWRISHTDYENGPFKWDVQLSGPMMGFTVKF